MTTPRLLALSDLHVAHPRNRQIVADLQPGEANDWLLLAGDVGELYPDIEWAPPRRQASRTAPDPAGHARSCG